MLLCVYIRLIGRPRTATLTFTRLRSISSSLMLLSVRRDYNQCKGLLGTGSPRTATSTFTQLLSCNVKSSFRTESQTWRFSAPASLIQPSFHYNTVYNIQPVARGESTLKCHSPRVHRRSYTAVFINTCVGRSLCEVAQGQRPLLKLAVKGLDGNRTCSHVILIAQFGSGQTGM